MRDTALAVLNDQGAFAATEYLVAQPDPVAAAGTFGEVIGHLYWQQKDIHRTVVMAQAGIQFGLTAALSLDAQDANKAKELRSAAKRLAYDLGSFTWPGWDEPGIELSAAYLAFGREAAQLNLRLARELDKGALPVSRAHWLLGAHGLAAGEFQDAARCFEAADTNAQTAGANDEALLNQGYGTLAMALLLPDDPGSRDPLLRLQAQLAETPEGSGLAAQLQTAAKVFGLSTEAALREEE